MGGRSEAVNVREEQWQDLLEILTQLDLVITSGLLQPLRDTQQRSNTIFSLHRDAIATFGNCGHLH